MSEHPPCFWDELSSDPRPVWLYGTGNGADKILDTAARFGIRISGVFASDGFVRDRTFRGFPVVRYSEVRERCGDDFVILQAFGTNRPEVVAFIRELDARHTLIIPEVPLYGGELFDSRYAAAHEKELAETRSLLADERSTRLFDDAVSFRLTGRLSCLRDTEPFALTCASLLGGERIGTAVDGGAFRGDTARDMIEALRPDRILAVEADPKTAAKLASFAAEETRAEVTPVNAALWDEDGSVSYASGGSRGSGQEGRSLRSREIRVPSLTLDTLLARESADFIKLDVEGAEERAVRGGETVIRRDEPSMAVSLYHRTDDLWRLPERIHRLLPRHRLYLRRVLCIPMWDLTLWAVRPDGNP